MGGNRVDVDARWSLGDGYLNDDVLTYFARTEPDT